MNFFKNLEKFNSNNCLSDENIKKFSYKDIIQKSEKINEDLDSEGLVIVLANNHVDFVTSYLSFFRKGVVQMLVNPKIDKKQLEEIIKNYNPKYILFPNDRINEFKDTKIIYKLEKHNIAELHNENSYAMNKDLTLLLGTSGSTGSKKFVRVSYENIYENTKSIVKFLNIKENHKTITTMPPFYVYGLSLINTHLYAGASILVTKSQVVEKNFWRLMHEAKITSFAGVPFFYEILKKINFHKINLPDLQYFTQAGGPLKKNLIKYFLNFSIKNNKKFIVMYGQTEATARMTYLPFKMAKKKIGSIGIPIPGGKINLKSKKSLDDKEGEIVFNGKNVSLGYAQNYSDLKRGDDNKGKLFTGDLGKKDKDGYFYITGRKSRNIKLFGHRVNMDDLENILQKKGFNCICHGIDNKVTIFYKEKKDEKKILNYIKATTRFDKTCFKLLFIKKFPFNENGKISYKKLNKYL